MNVGKIIMKEVAFNAKKNVEMMKFNEQRRSDVHMGLSEAHPGKINICGN